MTPNGRSEWIRVSHRRCCPICGKPDWCLYVGPETDPTTVICARIESKKRCGEAGWLHRLRNEPEQGRRFVHFDRPKPGPVIDFEHMAENFQLAVAPDRLAALANALAVSVESLRRMLIGWSECHRAWAFPMVDVSGAIRGIRLRRADGRKWSVKGGREGLFIPLYLGEIETLLICEGPTDTAAILDIGLPAIGRPSCRGGVGLVVDHIQRTKPAQVVILSDSDGPGTDGAESLASVLMAYAAVRVITPSDGTKDARDWKRNGAGQRDVLAAINAAPVRRLSISSGKADHE